MKSSNQKLKILYLAKILLSETDEEHTLTISDIIKRLEDYGIRAERKSLYDDIEHLSLFGLDICSNKTRTTNYYIASRDFELPELKLLVDTVQSSKFITTKKSMELISKIEKLTSKENAKKLQRQVFLTSRVKTLNEKIYYNVDKIHDAIAANKQITFRYFYLNLDKQKIYRKNGDLYTESPVSLTWDDENYYLITYKQKYDSYTHYRVDKMESITITDLDRVLSSKPFDLSSYAKSTFQMFGGTETDVMIEFDNSLVGVVFDRFGTDVTIIKKGEDRFMTRVKVALSPQFLSWIMSFGSKVKIISPDFVIDELKTLAQNIYEIYD